MRTVRLHAHFAADLQRQVDWLVDAERIEWLDGLFAGLEEVRDRIAAFPEIGVMEQFDDAVVVRRLVLRRLPLVAWYGYLRADPIGDVWMLRLFGSKQRRPKVPPSSWKML